MRKKVLVVTEGNAYSPQIWSNVPYFVVTTLEKKGFRVINVNVGMSSSTTDRLLRSIARKSKKLFGLGDLFDYDRTLLWKSLQDQKVRNYVKAYPDAAFLLYISTTPVKLPSGIKTSLLFDFSIDYTIRQLQNREPMAAEKLFLERQNAVLTRMDCVFVLFEKAAQYYRRTLEGGHFYNLPGHFINSDETDFDAAALYEKRLLSRRILFIGKIHYLGGANCLARAVTAYNQNHST